MPRAQTGRKKKERLSDWQLPLEQLCCVSRDCDVAGQRGQGNLSEFRHSHRSLRLKRSDGTYQSRTPQMAIGIAEHPLDQRAPCDPGHRDCLRHETDFGDLSKRLPTNRCHVMGTPSGSAARLLHQQLGDDLPDGLAGAGEALASDDARCDDDEEASGPVLGELAEHDCDEAAEEE